MYHSGNLFSNPPEPLAAGALLLRLHGGLASGAVYQWSVLLSCVELQLCLSRLTIVTFWFWVGLDWSFRLWLCMPCW